MAKMCSASSMVVLSPMDGTIANAKPDPNTAS